MAQLFDTLPQFFDAAGRPLAGGRLVIYKYLSTTELADIYLDPDQITPANNPFTLDNAGVMPMNVYVFESITVHVQKFVGLDEFGADIFADVKVYHQLYSIDAGSSVTAGFVNNIADLKQEVLEHGKCVTVIGYYTSGDCPARVFQYNENETALDNAGTIIESALTSQGRWTTIVEGHYVDCRIFGLIANGNTINSSFVAAQNYCTSVEKTMYIPKGTYALVGGSTYDSYCKIKVDGCVLFTATSTYTWKLHNEVEIVDTLASTNVTLNIAEDLVNPIPATAFSNNDHVIQCTGKYTPHFTTSITVSASSTCEFENIMIDEGVTIIFKGADYVKANEIIGLGKVSMLDGGVELKTLKMSNVENTTYSQSKMMAACTDIIYLDTPVTVSNGTVISALIISTSTLSHTGTITVSGGIEGKHNTFLSDAAINVGYRNLDCDFWSNSSGLVKSFNASTGVPFLDMKGASASTTNVTRGGKLINGTVGKIVCNAGIELEDMTINANVLGVVVSATDIIANNCNFVTIGNGSLFGSNCTSKRLTYCGVYNNGNTPLNVDVSNSIMTEVGFVGANTSAVTNISAVGGSARLTNVAGVNIATFIPNSSLNFGNFDWIGGTVNTINFDATQSGVVGEAVAYNVKIQNLLGCSGNINAINNSSLKWAVNGHYNIKIGDNEGENTLRTYGSSTAQIGLWSGDNGVINSMKMLVFNKAKSTWIPSGRLFSAYSTTANKPWTVFAYVYPGETAPLVSSFIGAPAFRAYKIVGSPSVGDPCIVSFEIYG